MKYETIKITIPEIFDGSELLFSSDILNVHAPGSYLITGPNGCGKSTLLRLVLGLNSENSFIHHEVRALQPSYLPERLSVDGVLKVSTYIESWNDIYQDLGLHDTKKYLHLYEAFNIKAFEDKSLSDLSKGMLQKVFLLLCLGRKSGFILLDEPFNGLDTETKQTLIVEIDTRVAEGAMVWIVSHETDLILSHVDNVLSIDKKRVNHIKSENLNPVTNI